MKNSNSSPIKPSHIVRQILHSNHPQSIPVRPLGQPNKPHGQPSVFAYTLQLPTLLARDVLGLQLSKYIIL